MVTFCGGEPLINFPLIKKCIQYIDYQYSDYDVHYLQIPAHPTTHSAKNWSAFPDVTEHISASADQ